MRIEREFAQTAADRLRTFMPISVDPCPSDLDRFADWLQSIKARATEQLGAIGLIIRSTESPDVGHDQVTGSDLVEVDRHFVTTTEGNWRDRYSEAICVVLVETSGVGSSLHLNDANHKVT